MVVQAPADSEHPEMPQSALNVVAPDFTLPVNQIGPLLASLVSGAMQPDRRAAMSEPVDKSFGAQEGQSVDEKQLGTPTAFSCPECSGTLWELEDGQLLRYRCRVGHA